MLNVSAEHIPVGFLSRGDDAHMGIGGAYRLDPSATNFERLLRLDGLRVMHFSDLRNSHGWPVAVFWSSDPEDPFHFKRKNRHGGWSHKRGDFKPRWTPFPFAYRSHTFVGIWWVDPSHANYVSQRQRARLG